MNDEEKQVCSHCGAELVNEDCPNYGFGEQHAPESMQPGWNPETPGRDYQRRLLDASDLARSEGDLDEADRLAALAAE